MTWHATTWASAWLLAAGFGPCTGSDEPSRQDPATSEVPAPVREATPAPSPVAAPPRQTATARAYMRAHFAQSEDMRRALIRGDLPALRAAAEGVAQDPWTPNLREDWRPHVTAVRDAARAAQTAVSLEAGAQALTELGAACSSCHLLTGGPGSPRFPVPMPGSTEGMLAHESATERLWQGIVAPSDAAWAEGADALLAAPELSSDVEDIAQRAAHVRDLARRARSAAASERPQLFGELLLTCTNCHQRVGIKPAPAARP